MKYGNSARRDPHWISDRLTRHFIYTIDYLLGSLWFKPVADVCVCVFNDLPPSCEGLTRMSNAPISCFPPPSPYTHRRPTVRQRWIYTFPIPAPIFASFAGGRRVKGGIISVNPFYFHPSPPSRPTHSLVFNNRLAHALA